MHTCDVRLNDVNSRLHKLQFNPQGLYLIDMLCLTEPRKLGNNVMLLNQRLKFEAIGMQRGDTKLKVTESLKWT